MTALAAAVWPLGALLALAGSLAACSLIMVLLFMHGAARLDDGPER